MAKSKMAQYKEDLYLRYWDYQISQFPNVQKYFERPFAPDRRPPVFIRDKSWWNIIINPNANQNEINRLLTLMPTGTKHRWFGSMSSSQALALSVLGNIVVHDYFHNLFEIKCDEGLDLFGETQISSENFSMEYKIDYLGEPRQTSLDGFISGDYQIAIECKFTEEEFGTCSRPQLTKDDSNYKRAYCNGSYSIQSERKERCSYSEQGIRYWQYVPFLFNWNDSGDLNPCPLNKSYQLVRNVLAAGIKPNGKVACYNGHVILIYDERNPHFQEHGDALSVYTETREALKEPKMLRKCSWQRIINNLRDNDILPWLTNNLFLKYGF